jgi:hypothetical protein
MEIRIVAQQGGGVNMADSELYQNLLEAAESVLRNDMLLNGVSDPAELAGHAWMLIKEGTWKLPEGEVSYVRFAKNARAILTAGSSPYRRDQRGNFVKHKYGKFVQYQGLEDQIAGFNYYEDESDLDEVLPLILGMMSNQGREIIETIQPFEGNVNAYAESFNLNDNQRRTLHNRVEKARKEFLSLIPEDCVLYNTSRRLRQRYNIGASDVN